MHENTDVAEEKEENHLAVLLQDIPNSKLRNLPKSKTERFKWKSKRFDDNVFI